MAKHRGYKIIRSVGDVENLNTIEKELIVEAVNEVKFDTDSVTTKADSHIASNLPHRFEDLKDNTFYLFGLQKSKDGIMQIISKEIE